MAWYRTGTVTVANGSAAVTGAGTDFVQNTQAGEAFRGPDGRTYEIAAVVSATQLTLGEAYMGVSGAGQAYAISPTASLARDLALGVSLLLNGFAAVRDGVGQGLFPDGTVAAPGIRFAADQDTGARRIGPNVFALTAGGRDVITLGSYVGIGTGNPIHKLHVNNTSADPTFVLVGNNNNGLGVGVRSDGFPALLAFASSGFAFGAALGGAATEFARFDAAGNLLVGITSAICHSFYKPVSTGPVSVFGSTATAARSLQVQSCDAEGFSGTATALYVGRATTSGRSINAGGTVNASGADYAEYMTKASGCGLIAKGDVCGVDVDGRLTRMWADAHSFVIKSTDPSYVGGDVWGQSVGPRPEDPGEKPFNPIAPPAAPASEDEADVEAWRAIVAAYPAQQAAYQSAHAAWTTAKAAYDTALPAWEAALEVERQKVDRIAFAGQVPVNVTGDFAVGDYIIAAASGAGIKAVAVPAEGIPLDVYLRRVGKVWAVRDGRAWVDVQHG